MNDNFSCKVIIILFSICLLSWLFIEPKSNKTYILPTWDKPTAMCGDDTFTWNDNHYIGCEKHRKIKIVFVD